MGSDYFLPQSLPAPVFSLQSHAGTPVSSNEFPGKILAVFFGYTSCPDICPLTLSHLSQALVELGENAGRVQVLFVTVDPERDTASRMKEYLAAFGPSFLGLRGEEAEIRVVVDGFGAYFRKNNEEGNYTVDHTARVFIVDGSARIPLTFPLEASPLEMARDLTLLLEDPSG
jgi:protein SCO1/2